MRCAAKDAEVNEAWGEWLNRQGGSIEILISFANLVLRKPNFFVKF